MRPTSLVSGTDAFTHETLGKALLGVVGDGPRW
jgi:hypothetical protein